MESSFVVVMVSIAGFIFEYSPIPLTIPKSESASVYVFALRANGFNLVTSFQSIACFNTQHGTMPMP